MQRPSRTLSAVALAMAFAAAPAPAQDRGPAKPAPARAAAKHYNLDKQKLAIQGYDPVAYFAEGGGKAQKGSARFTATHAGVTYRFASKQNRERFLKSPSKYEPAYGGWCAYAMRVGDKVEVDAESFLVQDGRLLLFYNGFWGNTRKTWSRGDTKAQAKKADGAWKKISGEAAPQPKRARPKGGAGGKQPPRRARG
jgi:YHS domain-containing protein